MSGWSLTESKSGSPAWTASPPSAYDIVACWYPEDETPDDPGPELRPALVLTVLQGKNTGAFACRVAYGSKMLKIIKRQAIDLIIQKPQDVGLPRQTRFDLDRIGTFPWQPPFFDCWRGYTSPVIGALTEEYIREYAFIMMKRGSA
jgi:hypothetical protein